jgi:hypothetical protein
MLVGHLGAGLAAKAAAPKLNTGVLFGAAMLLDFALWVFVMTGAEAATVPADYTAHHYLYFNFPYSHSLIAALLWSATAAVAWAMIARGETSGRLFSFAGVIVALTVFSHWVLDALVHPPQLPLSPGGPSIGLDLWDDQPLALALELAIAGVGLALYLLRAGNSRRWVVTLVMLLAAAMTIWGALTPTPPPSVSLMAYVSLVVIVAIVAAGVWADMTSPSATAAES